MIFSGFDWDQGNKGKCRKHGVSIEEIETLLSRLSSFAPDLRHSDKEDRHIAIGQTKTGRAIFIGFTIRHKSGEQFVRPITARYMHERERKAYEAQST